MNDPSTTNLPGFGMPLVIATIALALSGCSKKEVRSDDALAEVNGQAVTEASFRYWWDRESPSADTPEAREAILDKLIERSAVAQQAREAGLLQDPAVIEAIESLLIAKLDEQELQPALRALSITDDEIHAAYETGRDEQFRIPPRLRAAVLWFDTRGQAPLAARYQPRLEKVRQVLLDDPATAPPEDGFGSMAIANSEHRPSRYKGGRLDWIETGASSPDPVQAAAAQIAAELSKPGDLSTVVVREEGVFLVRLLDRELERVRPLEEVRAQIETDLLAGKRAATREAYQDRMAAAVTVARHPDRLAALTGLPVRPSETSPLFPSNLSQNSSK